MNGLPDLPPLQRFALAYASAAARPATHALFALDARLGAVVSGAREPVIGQLRLAWWRDRLGESAAARPQGEPVLALLASWGDAASTLTGLVDGWEQMLCAEPLTAAACEALVSGRARAASELAQVIGLPEAGPEAARAARGWSAVEMCAGLEDPLDRAAALNQDWRRVRLPRALRPIAILHALAARAVRRGDYRAFSRPSDMFAGMRVGLFGA